MFDIVDLISCRALRFIDLGADVDPAVVIGVALAIAVVVVVSWEYCSWLGVSLGYKAEVVGGLGWEVVWFVLPTGAHDD